MTDVTQHYADLLAPIYVWMSGGLETAMQKGNTEIEALFPQGGKGATAVDLGAGFGKHSIPLARRGFNVLALDSSTLLLGILRDQAEGLSIRSIQDDLCSFPGYLIDKAGVILCMGDTLAHLSGWRAVEDLFAATYRNLAAGGIFVLEFRDYTATLEGAARFIPVRSDRDRILTCFLEFSGEAIIVHDILHERTGDSWQMRSGAYRKLRVTPDEISRRLDSCGFLVRQETGSAGMIRMVATKHG